MDIKAEAELLRLKLIAGLTSVADVIAWADEVIRAAPEPESSVIDVALAGRKGPADVAALLREVPGSYDPVSAARGLLGAMLQDLERDPQRGRELAQTVYRLACAGELPEEHFGWEAFGLDENFYLVDVGAFTEAEALAGLREYLSRNGS